MSTTDIPTLQIRKLRQRVVMRLSRITQVGRDTPGSKSHPASPARVRASNDCLIHHCAVCFISEETVGEAAVRRPGFWISLDLTILNLNSSAETIPAQAALLIHEGVDSSQLCGNGVQFQQGVFKGPRWCRTAARRPSRLCLVP